MSIQVAVPGTVTEPAPVALANALEADLFTQTDSGEFMAGFAAVNTNSGLARTLTVRFFDGSASYEIYQEDIPAKSTLLVTELPFRLRSSGAKFTAQASAGGDIVITPIVMLVPGSG